MSVGDRPKALFIDLLARTDGVQADVHSRRRHSKHVTRETRVDERFFPASEGYLCIATRRSRLVWREGSWGARLVWREGSRERLNKSHEGDLFNGLLVRRSFAIITSVSTEGCSLEA